MRSPRGTRLHPHRQRLAAVAVLGERDAHLSAAQRLALVDAAAWWLSEPNGGEKLAYALLAASCAPHWEGGARLLARIGGFRRELPVPESSVNPSISWEEITMHSAPPCPALRLHHHVRSAAALSPDPSDPTTLRTHRPGELVLTRRDSRSPHPDHHSAIRSTRGWAGTPDRKITSVNRRGWQDVAFRNLVLPGMLRLPGASAWVRPALPSPMQLEDPSPR